MLLMMVLEISRGEPYSIDITGYILLLWTRCNESSKLTLYESQSM